MKISGSDARSPVQIFVKALWPKHWAGYQLKALESLNALYAGDRFPARLFPQYARGRRLCFVLRALDGSLAGASHREIAEALIGEWRVDSDWTDPGEHLRDRIRRAVRRGHALVDNGYRAFLS
ncbi:DNA -binding domain-containing protein [Hoeflea poritis]|uniref:DUF2285 domain-containing protein n=1 Tax=Hoeflea poritis TaxID=2993659 RepID=A0ABT4VVZ1_9HYPH|nr:DUF2285 domain-containing protein [Hoeflea poritis]MDA4848877.1 DUF2285 domain-containing protein [Hoeflea poritis]